MTDRPDAPLHCDSPIYESLVPLFDRLVARAGGDVTRAHVIDEIRADPTLAFALAASAGHVDRTLDAGRGSDIERALVLTGVEWSAQANWRRHGRRVFTFSAPLVRLLEHTDFNVPRDVVRTPWPCVYLRWLDTGLVIDHHDGTRHALDGAYVFFERQAERVGLTAYVTSRAERIEATNAIHFTVDWSKPETPIRTEDMRTLGLTPSYIPAANLIVNSLLYLSSPYAELSERLSPRRELEAAIARTRNPKKIRRLTRDLARHTGSDYIYVGASVTLAETDGEGAKLTVHHWVRGHWKMQVHGSGRTERKPLWIKPYERGKDLAEQAHRRYRVV